MRMAARRVQKQAMPVRIPEMTAPNLVQDIRPLKTAKMAKMSPIR
jgi:hypothetical protein